MAGLFGSSQAKVPAGGRTDFGHMPADACYLDAACQTPRPQQVLDAEAQYYQTYNACGGRVKYPWGARVDRDVQNAREAVLRFAGKSSKEYAVAFTLNTTYGINLILHQLPSQAYERVVTSDIEHNSVFLPSISWSKRLHKERQVLSRNSDGSVPVDAIGPRAVSIFNTTSNIDGRMLHTVQDVADTVHSTGGILLVDAAQTFGHTPSFLHNVEYDAAFGSGHKMYGPSIGFVVIKRTLLEQLEPFFIGGGTVSDVREDTYDLVDAHREPWARLEAGLQNWGGIIGLGAAVQWLSAHKNAHAQEAELGQRLYDGLARMERVKLLNTEASSIISFWVEGMDAHTLAVYLGQQSIMCRSGHFCCHYYLEHTLKLPPLLRVSLGLHNTQRDIDHFLQTVSTILYTL